MTLATIKILESGPYSTIQDIGRKGHQYLGVPEGGVSDLISFNISLNNPSKIAELQELEHFRTKFDIAGAATEGFFSKRWVYESIFNLSDEEVERILSDQFFDRKHDALLEAVAEGVTADSASMGGEGAGDDLGGDDALGDLGGEEGGDEGGNIIAEGTPEEITNTSKSYTGLFLKEVMNN